MSASASVDCPGSWDPVFGAQLGDALTCVMCGRRVHVTLPPVFETTPDRWKGKPTLRVAPHWWPVERPALARAS